MTDRPDLTQRENALREDLGREYYAILDTVSEYDGRFLVVKGWSVTLSLAALGLGFQQEHYALFGLAAATALGFWFLDVLMKRFQLRYYGRMRDIEVAAYHLNAIELPDLGLASAPRIDMSWGYKGDGRDWRTDPPERRDAAELHYLHHLPWWMPNVLLPHAVAVVIGTALFVAAAAGVPWLDGLQP